MLKQEEGFTLIEIIMASLILVVGMTIISSVISDATHKNFYSHLHTQAVILAQNKIEDLLNAGYGDPAMEPGEYENDLNPVNSTGDSAGVFYQFWEITDMDPIPRSKRIKSLIQWDDPNGDVYSVVLNAVCIDQSN